MNIGKYNRFLKKAVYLRIIILSLKRGIYRGCPERDAGCSRLVTERKVCFCSFEAELGIE